MEETGDHIVEGDKQSTEDKYQVFTRMQNLDLIAIIAIIKEIILT
jgi:hypothetical protein